MKTTSKHTPKKKAERPSRALRVLFPTRSIVTPDDGKVTMQPIPLRRLPAVMEQFMTIFSFSSQGVPVSQLMMLAGESLFTLIDECIVEGKKTDVMSSTAFPFIAEAFMDMNLPPEALGKWGALISRVKEAFPGASGLIQSESLPSPSNT